MSSMTESIHASAAALVACERFLGENRTWMPYGKHADRQTAFLVMFEQARRELGQLPIESIAEIGNEAPVNEFLGKKGVDIRLGKIVFPHIASAAVLDCLMTWAVPGTKCKLRPAGSGTFYPAASIKGGCMVYKVRGHIVVCIRTTGADKVYLTCPNGAPASSHELYEIGRTLANSENHGEPSDFSGVQFPMVNLKYRPDISYLLGLTCPDTKLGVPGVIEQALQEVSIRMNHLGARVKDAAAFESRMLCAEDPYVIDRPFVATFHRDNLVLPYMVAYCDTDCWADPGDLNA